MLKLLLECGADLYATNNVSSNLITGKFKKIFLSIMAQDGGTPYSIALSGRNMDTANYVMAYASKTPQRDSGGPMKIFNLQVIMLLSYAAAFIFYTIVSCSVEVKYSNFHSLMQFNINMFTFLDTRYIKIGYHTSFF